MEWYEVTVWLDVFKHIIIQYCMVYMISYQFSIGMESVDFTLALYLDTEIYQCSPDQPSINENYTFSSCFLRAKTIQCSKYTTSNTTELQMEISNINENQTMEINMVEISIERSNGQTQTLYQSSQFCSIVISYISEGMD